MELSGGSSRQALGFRLGGSVGNNLAWRAGVRWLREDAGLSSATDAPANDPFQRLGGDLRVDGTPTSRDCLTLSGAASKGRLGEFRANFGRIPAGRINRLSLTGNRSAIW